MHPATEHGMGAVRFRQVLWQPCRGHSPLTTASRRQWCAYLAIHVHTTRTTCRIDERTMDRQARTLGGAERRTPALALSSLFGWHFTPPAFVV